MIWFLRASLGIMAIAILALGLQAMRVSGQDAGPSTITSSPSANLWARHTRNAAIEVDHEPWTAFLQGATVEERGITVVAYSGLRGAPRRLLDEYVAWLVTLTPSAWDRDEQLAYWLNLHNALTVQAIAEAGGRGSIDRFRQLPVAQSGPFAERSITVEGQPLSIDAIVQEVLRPNFGDTAFHYGLFNGARGGPTLRRTAFTGADVHAALTEQAREYVNGRGVRVSRRELQLSSLYDWYADDFGGSDAAILGHVSGYADDRLKSGLAERATIDGYRYDLGVAAIIPRRFEPLGDGGLGSSRGGGGHEVGGGS
jgi:hypothetical protein